MIDELARRRAPILIDNGKRRAVDDIFHAQLLADGFDKGCLPCPHAAAKGKNRSVVHVGNKLARCFPDCIQTSRIVSKFLI